MKHPLLALLALGFMITASPARSFYKGDALFSKRPDEKKSAETIGRFGPVGMAIDGSSTSEKPDNCPLDFCRHGESMQTLWEKEVLLLRGKFRFPALKEGHRYALRLGGMSHVGAGEGGRI